MVSAPGWELEGSSGTEGFRDLWILVLIHCNQFPCENSFLRGQPGWFVCTCVASNVTPTHMYLNQGSGCRHELFLQYLQFCPRYTSLPKKLITNTLISYKETIISMLVEVVLHVCACTTFSAS